ncbi:MAG: GNAT family N-acetyltransferase [Acidimicrobiia bacterium]|nr:GNAT family N-acetyltransferase [Acidimicrobiia bacterium]
MNLRPARATDLYLFDQLSDPDDPDWVRQPARFLVSVAWSWHLDGPGRYFMAAEIEGDLVGAIAYERQGAVWFINAICLFPEHRQHHHGPTLLTLVFDEMQRLGPTISAVHWRRHTANEPMRAVGEAVGATELSTHGPYITVAVPLA